MNKKDIYPVIGPYSIPLFGTKQEYVNPTTNHNLIATVSAGLPIGVSTFNSENVELINGMNFNSVMAHFNSETSLTDIQTSFEALKETDIKLIISLSCPSNSELDIINNWKEWINCIREWRSVVETFFDKKNLGGWFLADKPSYSVFWKLSEIKDNILSIYTKKCGYGGIEKANIIYANLYDDPSESQANGKIKVFNANTKETKLTQLKTIKSDSEDGYTLNYYKKFLSVFNPALWSYEYFAFEPTVMGGVIIDPLTPKLRNNFFERMMRIKKISDLSGKPFWAYVKTDYYKESNFQYARPTLGSLRFAVFSALAFGAKGIVFKDIFKTVKQSELYPTTPGEKLFKPAAPIMYITDDYGRFLRYDTTDIYNMVLTINEEISHFSVNLALSTFIEGGAYPKKLNEDTGINVISLENFDKIDSIEFYDKQEDGEEIIEVINDNPVGIILTRFKENGQNLYMIVNQDYAKSQGVRIKFNTYMLCLQSQVFGVVNFSEELEPGQCVVFHEPYWNPDAKTE